MEPSRFIEIYKSRSLRFATAVQPASLSQRLSNLHQQRQSSRNTFMMQKRNIVEGALTPVHSPASTKKTKVQEPIVREEKKDPRLEMLRKWQEEKKKRLEQQRVNKKPLFKVHHVEQKPLCNLEKVYAEIKGKPVVKCEGNKLKSAQSQPSIAPSSTYKFKPPANIRPINLKVVCRTASSCMAGMPKSKTEPAPSRPVTRSQTSAASQPRGTRQRLDFNQPTTSGLVETKTLTKKIKGVLKIAPPKASTSNFRLNTVGLALKKTPVKVLSPARDGVGNSRDSTRLAGGEKSSSGGAKAQKRRSRSLTQLGRSLEKVEKSVNVGRRSRKPALNRQHCIDLSSPDTANVKSNTKTDLVPDSANDNDVQKKEVSDKGEQTKLESSTSSSLSSEYPVTDEVTTSGSESPKTPGFTDKNSPPSAVYVSPFVTLSRGKENARKEFQRRSLRGGTDFQKSTSPKAAAMYFYKLLDNQTNRLRSLCHKWNIYKDEQNPAEEACDMINVAVGQTELLLNKKFQQFRGLVESCETGNSEKPVTCLDLHGFWEMVMIQVDNLDKRFQNLDKLKENAWEEILPTSTITKNQRKKPKRKAVAKSATGTSTLRAAIQEARRKKAELQAANQDEILVPSTFEKSRRSRRSSLRVSTMVSEGNRAISSPGLTMMKVTQAAKSAEKLKAATPSKEQVRSTPKSILKVRRSKSAGQKSKIVLFKESDTSTESVEQENDQNASNMICFSPVARVTRSRKSTKPE